MGRQKKILSRGVRVTVRFTESEFERIRAASMGRTRAEAVRNFALQGAGKAEEDIRATASLIAKLESADLSKIAETQNMILAIQRQTVELLSRIGEVKSSDSDITDAIEKLRHLVSLMVRAIPTVAKEISRDEALKKFIGR